MKEVLLMVVLVLDLRQNQKLCGPRTTVGSSFNHLASLLLI